MNFATLLVTIMLGAGQDIADMEELAWRNVAPGVWSARVGSIDDVRLSQFAGAPPKLEALLSLGEQEFPFEHDACRGQVQSGRASMRLPLGQDERLYGLGLQFRGIERRGQVQHLRVDHYGGSRGRTHAPVPFYISSAGYGVLFDTARPIALYPGIGNRKDSPAFPPIRDRNTDPAWAAQPESDAVEASVEGPGLDVIVFAGPTPLDAIRRYVLYFGGGALPPRWGLGFWHRTPTNATAAEIIAEVEQFAKLDFPLSVIGLEPGWQTKSYPCTFDWNPATFPDPKGFIESLTQRDIRVNLWENPYVSPESSLYEEILPYTGSHTVWLGVVPDYTLAPARDAMIRHHRKTHVEVGVSGYKIDEVDGIDEWLWPDHATFPSGTPGILMRQTYGLQMQQSLTEMFRERNQRTFGLVRGTNGGGPAYPFVIYSDYYNHRGYVTALANSGFSGLMWTPEIRSARSEEEWVRRMQTVCLSHLAQLNAWASGTKPWSMPNTNELIRDAMKLRMRLVPYLYTAYAAFHFEGTPPIRSVVLEPGFPSDANSTKLAETEFMLGDSLLVAPAFTGEQSRDIAFPAGAWYDFFTGKKIANGGDTIALNTPLDRIPLFVRDGAIIPLAPESNSVVDEISAIELLHYGEATGQGRLYWDDGETYGFEDDEYAWYALFTRASEESKFEIKIEQISGRHDSGSLPRIRRSISMP